MPNNFRKTGVFYCSKNGDDSNDGLTPDTPVASLQEIQDSGPSTNGVLDDVIIGAGQWSEATIPPSATKAQHWIADGKVVFTNPVGGTADLRTGVKDKFTGIEFRNLNRLYNGTHNFSSGGPGGAYDHCILDSIVECDFPGQYGKNITNTKCINVTRLDNNQGIFSGCLVISCPDVEVKSLKNCYVDSISVINFPNGTTTTRFGYSNIQGVLVMEGFSYAIQDQLTGTPQDNGYKSGVQWMTDANLTANGHSQAGSDWDTIIATCYNRDPQFVNAAIGDFNVQAGSIMLENGEAGINIGNVQVGKSYSLSSGNLSVESITNLQVSGNSYIIQSPATSGTILLSPMKLSDGSLESIELLDFLGELNFNTDIPSGATGNTDVPDAAVYTAGNAGRNPNRLSYELRWSSTASDTEPSSWNNGGFVALDDFAFMEFGDASGSVPMIDTSGKGNGDAVYDPANGVKIVASWIQVRITLTDSYDS